MLKKKAKVKLCGKICRKHAFFDYKTDVYSMTSWTFICMFLVTTFHRLAEIMFTRM